MRWATYDQLVDATTNTDHLRIRKVAFELASDVEHTPELGNFEQISLSVGRVGKAADLRYAPHAESNLRYLEIRVTSESGKTSEQRIKQGANKEVGSFLRRVQTPSIVLRTMNALRAL